MASDKISTAGLQATAASEKPTSTDHEVQVTAVLGIQEEGMGKESVDDKPAGVAKVERFSEVLYHSGRSGKILLWTLAISIFLTMVGYALDQGITANFTAIAASSFGRHADLAAINTAASILRAISKPFLGKLSDITSRPTTYIVVLLFYCVGFVVAASCTNITAYTLGIAFTAIGKSGLDLLSDIITGDLTPLQWRAFIGSLFSTPFLFTTFINGALAEAFVPNNWRWGLGIFAIMIPALMVPAIWTLYVIQRKASKMGVTGLADSGIARRGGAKIKSGREYVQIAWQGIIDIDLAGLVLLGFAFSLILLPFTLAKGANGGWGNPSMIAMLICGFVILGIFIAWEMFMAPQPVMKRSILFNKAWLCAMLVDFTTQMASSTRTGYFASYLYIIKDWSEFEWQVFYNTTLLTICFVSPLGGLLHRYTHRYKTIMLIGAILKMVGSCLHLSVGARSTQSTAQLAVAQILLGFGGLSVIGAKIASQGSVPHADLSSAISLLSLWSTLGSSIGGAIGGAIWSNTMLSYMRQEFSGTGTSDATIKKIYGSIRDLRQYEFDSPVRRAAIRAYTETNFWIFVVAAILGAMAVFFTLLVPNYYLGKEQNAVTMTGVDGRSVEVKLDMSRQRYAGPGLWNRMRRVYFKES